MSNTLKENGIKELILGIVTELLEEKELTMDEDLTLRGLDSIKSIELIVELESQFEVMFEDSELLLDNFKTVELIEQKINEKMGK